MMGEIKLGRNLKFKTVDTRTLKGLKRAEWLKARGWQIVQVGFTTLTMMKRGKK